MGQGLVNRSSDSEQGTPPGAEVASRPTFAELYETTFTFVWRSARRLGTPEPNLDDVVQEIFLVAFRRQDEFEGRSSLKTWLYGIVFNVVRAHRRELAKKHPQVLDGDRRVDPEVLIDRSDGPQERVSKRQAHHKGQLLRVRCRSRTSPSTEPSRQIQLPGHAETVVEPGELAAESVRAERHEYVSAGAEFRRNVVQLSF